MADAEDKALIVLLVLGAVGASTYGLLATKRINRCSEGCAPYTVKACAWDVAVCGDNTVRVFE